MGYNLLFVFFRAFAADRAFFGAKRAKNKQKKTRFSIVSRETSLETHEFLPRQRSIWRCFGVTLGFAEIKVNVAENCPTRCMDEQKRAVLEFA